MTPRIPSPAVCVIDDDPAESRIILDSLTRLGMAAVHFRGDDLDVLPPEGAPLAGLRLVFTDLNINNAAHKMSVGYTVNVFRRVVSAEHGPVFTVIWSKYAEESDSADGKTNAQRFQEILFDQHPEYRGAVFVEIMEKPSGMNHTTKNVTLFKKKVSELLNRWRAFDLLLRWESVLQLAALKTADNLLKLAKSSLPSGQESGADQLSESLDPILRTLVKAQGAAGKPFSSLVAILASLTADHLDHSPHLEETASQHSWLGDQTGIPRSSPHQPKINSMLLLGPVLKGSVFVPGTVYEVVDAGKFEKVFGGSTIALIEQCFDTVKDEWSRQAKVVAIELSPECDVQQSSRKTALLVAGVIIPHGLAKHGRRGDSWSKLPLIRLDNTTSTAQDICLVFHSRFKATVLPAAREPKWLKPLFRLRELPVASLRNWHAAQSARVGYVSL